MSFLGSLGQLYMFILLVLLFMGIGFALWSFIGRLMKSDTSKTKPATQQININENKERKILGGIQMVNNAWFKLAIFSFVGILVSMVVLGFISSSAAQMGNMNNMNNMNNMQMGNMPMNNNMPMQGNMNMNGNMPMGNMPMQGNMNMNGNMQMNSMPMSGNMPMNSMPMSNDPSAMMMQQLQQMQQQMNQMQQQMMQMQQMNMGGGASGGGSMPSGGGMGMM